MQGTIMLKSSGMGKAFGPASTVRRKAVKAEAGSIWLGDRQRIGMCCRTLSTNPIFCR